MVCGSLGSGVGIVLSVGDLIKAMTVTFKGKETERPKLKSGEPFDFSLPSFHLPNHTDRVHPTSINQSTNKPTNQPTNQYNQLSWPRSAASTFCTFSLSQSTSLAHTAHGCVYMYVGV